jgi:polyribonucleotide nucleotidyltransferase
VDRIKDTYNALSDEAQPAYLTDDLLLRRINAARRQFNDWMGKRRRMAEMASPMEAGRSKYPMRRAQKLSRLEQRASDDLDERIRRIKSAARGARQRALNAVGSSVAEQTERRREQRRQELRDRLGEGSIVAFRNPQLRVGRVVRVNRRSIRVRTR